MPTKKLDQVLYYERYVVVQAGITVADGISYMDFLTEEGYLNILDTLPRDNQQLKDADPNKFIAKMGAEALEMLLARTDLDTLSAELRNQASNDNSQQRRVVPIKRLKIVESFREAKRRIANKPEWMILRIISVIPPQLKPLVPLTGGRFARSDLNDLYRRVIFINNRLKILIDIKALNVLLRNEKRMLQGAERLIICLIILEELTQWRLKKPEY